MVKDARCKIWRYSDGLRENREKEGAYPTFKTSFTKAHSSIRQSRDVHCVRVDGTGSVY